MDKQGQTSSTFAEELRGKGGEHLEKLRKEFRQVRLDKVIPLASWIKDKPWNVLWVRWFLLYALVPFVLLNLLHSHAIDFKDLTWAFGLYFALTWLIVLHFCMRPEKLDIVLLGQVGLFTAVVGIILVLFGQTLPVFDTL